MNVRDNNPNLDALRAPFFKKISAIKKGEFPRLYKHGMKTDLVLSDPNQIPHEQISLFEKKKSKWHKLAHAKELIKAEKSDDKLQTKLTGIDEILAIRDKLGPLKPSEQLKREKKSVKKTATEKMKEGSLKAWVDQCYATVHRKDPAKMNRSVKELLHWDQLPLSVDNIFDDGAKVEHEGSIHGDTSSENQKSSDEEKNVLRAKAGIPVLTGRKTKYRDGFDLKNLKQGSVNSVLKNYYIRDQNELERLVYNEELYAYHPTQGIVGSWKVDMKISEDDPHNVNVEFEGLLIDGEQNYAMFCCGVVTREFEPVTEFRVEQVSSYNESVARTMFFHRRGTDWMFDLTESVGDTETRKPFFQNLQQMQRVISEAAHILLIRKIVTFCNPFSFDSATQVLGGASVHNEMCPCLALASACTCHYHKKPRDSRIKTSFKLKMKSVTIGGDVCKTNYRFYTPTTKVFNGVQVDVVRIRRRIQMPGDLTQMTNIYMTTAGQIVAITFEDPYPFDTDYWLQVDPKAVLDPQRVIAPARMVPLRERYMCDPQLKQFYDSEVERLMAVNRSYIGNDPNLKPYLQAILQDLFNDKPHRVLTFIQNFFIDSKSESLKV